MLENAAAISVSNAPPITETTVAAFIVLGPIDAARSRVYCFFA
jgi:hypothetical protein